MSFVQKIGKIKFPLPAYRKCNMLPFIMGDKDSIPSEYQAYWPIIEKCDIEESELGKVGYLTITESWIGKGKYQRRSGLHTDGHGGTYWGSGWGGGDFFETFEETKPPISKKRTRHQGIYIASDVARSCRLWNYNIEKPGLMGDCESMRKLIENSGPSIYTQANTLYWMTDGTPHESLPMRKDTHRCFFRLVTSPVDVWYAMHSTPNPLGIKPSPGCKIIYSDKFS